MAAVTSRLSAESLIRANVITDAFATSFLTAGIGFLAIQVGTVNSDVVMRSVGAGIAIGAFSSLILGKAADRYGSREILSVVQVLQLVTYTALCFTQSTLTLVASVFSAFFLGRLVSPLRGALPPRYLRKAKLISFKAQLRTATLITVLPAAASISTIASMDWNIKYCIASTGLFCYTVCLASTKLLSQHSPHSLDSQQEPNPVTLLSRREWLVWISLLSTFSAITISAAMAPFVVAQAGPRFSWLIFASSLVGIAVNLSIQQQIGRKQKNKSANRNGIRNRGYLALAILLGAFSFLLIALIFLTTPGTILFSLIMLGVFMLMHTAQTLATIVAWNVQYNAGHERNRATIIAIFSLTGSAGTAIAQFLGAHAFSALSSQDSAQHLP